LGFVQQICYHYNYLVKPLIVECSVALVHTPCKAWFLPCCGFLPVKLWDIYRKNGKINESSCTYMYTGAPSEHHIESIPVKPFLKFAYAPMSYLMYTQKYLQKTPFLTPRSNPKKGVFRDTVAKMDEKLPEKKRRGGECSKIVRARPCACIEYVLCFSRNLY